MKGNIEKFWKAHQKSPIAKIPEAKGTLNLHFFALTHINHVAHDIYKYRFINKNVMF